MTHDDDRRERAHQAEQAVIRHALDLAGPWPALTTSRAQNVEVLDVDRYEGFGVVLSAIERSSLGHGPTLHTDLFRRDNGWQPMGGSGSGGGRRSDDPLVQRQQWKDPANVILRRGGGRCRPWRQGHGGPAVCHAKVLCSPAVASVVVDRPSDRRFLDVTKGPGWIAIVWPEGSEPRVTAFGGAGEELDYLDPGLFGRG